eukprot:987675-Pyramimonas_sp.AAC.1
MCPHTGHSHWGSEARRTGCSLGRNCEDVSGETPVYTHKGIPVYTWSRGEPTANSMSNVGV